MDGNKNWSIRRTDDRDTLMEGLREKMKAAGRKVETIHGVPTTAGVIEEALKELDKALDKELRGKGKERG